VQYWAFAEYMEIPFVSEESALKLPGTLDFLDLALMEPLQFACGIGEKAGTGETTLLLGADLLGLGAIAKLKQMGSRVIVSDISKKRCTAANEVGADITLEALDEDVVRKVMKETAGKGTDIVILNDPRPIAVQYALSTIKRGGLIWLVSFHYIFKMDQEPKTDIWVSPAVHYAEPPLLYNPELLSMRSIYGTFSKSRNNRTEQAIELVKSGKINAKKYVTHTFPLDKISEALEVASNTHESIKVVIEP